MACRTCLCVFADNSFKKPILDTSWTSLIADVLPQLCMDLSKDPSICDICNDKLTKLKLFKDICNDTEDKIKTFKYCHNHPEENVVDLRDVIIYHKVDGQNIDTDTYICRICLQLTVLGESRSLCDGTTHAAFINTLFPDMNIHLVLDPAICKVCARTSEETYQFQQMCLNVEDTLRDHQVDSQQLYTDDMVNIARKTRFAILQDDCYETVKATEDNGQRKVLSYLDSVIYDYDIKIVKDETVKEEETDDQNSRAEWSDTDITDDLDDIPATVLAIVGKMANSDGRKGKKITVHHLEDGTAVYLCNFCNYATKWKTALKRHTSTKHDETCMVYKCTQCDFKTKWKQHLSSHVKMKHLAGNSSKGKK